jgi:hypothetical protein
VPSGTSLRALGGFLSAARASVSVSFFTGCQFAVGWVSVGCQLCAAGDDFARTAADDHGREMPIFLVFFGCWRAVAEDGTEISGRRSRRFKSCHPDHFHMVVSGDGPTVTCSRFLVFFGSRFQKTVPVLAWRSHVKFRLPLDLSGQSENKRGAPFFAFSVEARGGRRA